MTMRPYLSNDNQRAPLLDSERDLVRRVLQQAHGLVEHAQSDLEDAANLMREAHRLEAKTRERQHEANVALCIGVVGCVALAVALFAGGWWAAGFELGVVGWLLLERRRR